MVNAAKSSLNQNVNLITVFKYSLHKFGAEAPEPYIQEGHVPLHTKEGHRAGATTNAHW